VLAAVVLSGCGDDEAPAPATAPLGDGPRAALVSLVPVDAVERGVWLLDPGAPDYPGSPFDLLLPTSAASLLLEAPAGPLVAVGGLPHDQEVPEQAEVRQLPGAGRTAVAGPARPPSEQTSPLLARLAATSAPVAWAGVVGGVEGLVTLDGDALRAELDGITEERVRDELEGSLPGSPGKRWSDVVADVDVRDDGGKVVVTARTTALPAGLLRTLIDGLTR
jgi:hypothetical protein